MAGVAGKDADCMKFQMPTLHNVEVTYSHAQRL
jgi:cytochrome c peroxidase